MASKPWYSFFMNFSFLTTLKMWSYNNELWNMLGHTGRAVPLQAWIHRSQVHRLRGRDKGRRRCSAAGSGHDRPSVRGHRCLSVVLPALWVRSAPIFSRWFHQKKLTEEKKHSSFKHTFQMWEKWEVIFVYFNLICVSRPVWRATLQQLRPGPRRAGCGLRHHKGTPLLAGEEQVNSQICEKTTVKQSDRKWNSCFRR